MTERWDLTRSSEAELFATLRDAALSKAQEWLKWARGHNASSMSEYIMRHYDAARVELEFARYWGERLRELRASGPDALSNLAELQDPNTE